MAWEVLAIALVSGALARAGVSLSAYAAAGVLMMLAAAIRVAASRRTPMPRTQFFAVVAAAYGLTIASDNTALVDVFLALGLAVAQAFYSLVTQLLGQVGGGVLGAAAALLAYLITFRVLMSIAERAEGFMVQVAALGASMLSGTVLLSLLQVVAGGEDPASLAIVITVGVAAAMDLFEAVRAPSRNLDKLASAAPLAPLAALLLGKALVVGLLSAAAVAYMAAAAAVGGRKMLTASLLMALAAAFASAVGE